MRADFRPRARARGALAARRVYGDDYFDWINDQVFVAIQIESIQAVQVAEAIMATPGIDGCWAGPRSRAVDGYRPAQGRPGRPSCPSAGADRDRLQEHGQSAGSGVSDARKDARRRAEQGFQFLTAGATPASCSPAPAAGLPAPRAVKKRLARRRLLCTTTRRSCTVTRRGRPDPRHRPDDRVVAPTLGLDRPNGRHRQPDQPNPRGPGQRGDDRPPHHPARRPVRRHGRHARPRPAAAGLRACR